MLVNRHGYSGSCWLWLNRTSNIEDASVPFRVETSFGKVDHSNAARDDWAQDGEWHHVFLRLQQPFGQTIDGSAALDAARHLRNLK